MQQEMFPLLISEVLITHHALYAVSLSPAAKVMLEYQPVDCDSGAALPYEPPYIDKNAIYVDGTRPGWGWFAYLDSYSQYRVPGGWGGVGCGDVCWVAVCPG